MTIAVVGPAASHARSASSFFDEYPSDSGETICQSFAGKSGAVCAVAGCPVPDCALPDRPEVVESNTIAMVREQTLSLAPLPVSSVLRTMLVSAPPNA
jgi:hypothetical protein